MSHPSRIPGAPGPAGEDDGSRGHPPAPHAGVPAVAPGTAAAAVAHHQQQAAAAAAVAGFRAAYGLMPETFFVQLHSQQQQLQAQTVALQQQHHHLSRIAAAAAAATGPAVAPHPFGGAYILQDPFTAAAAAAAAVASPAAATFLTQASLAAEESDEMRLATAAAASALWNQPHLVAMTVPSASLQPQPAPAAPAPPVAASPFAAPSHAAAPTTSGRPGSRSLKEAADAAVARAAFLDQHARELTEVDSHRRSQGHANAPASRQPAPAPSAVHQHQHAQTTPLQQQIEAHQSAALHHAQGQQRAAEPTASQQAANAVAAATYLADEAAMTAAAREGTGASYTINDLLQEKPYNAVTTLMEYDLAKSRQIREHEEARKQLAAAAAAAVAMEANELDEATTDANLQQLQQDQQRHLQLQEHIREMQQQQQQGIQARDQLAQHLLQHSAASTQAEEFDYLNRKRPAAPPAAAAAAAAAGAARTGASRKPPPRLLAAAGSGNSVVRSTAASRSGAPRDSKSVYEDWKQRSAGPKSSSRPKSFGAMSRLGRVVRTHYNRSNTLTVDQVADAIPKEASCVFHVLDRRINLDSFHRDASFYSFLRAWVQDDPYRYTPPAGSNLLDYIPLPSQRRIQDQEQSEKKDKKLLLLTTGGRKNGSIAADQDDTSADQANQHLPVDVLSTLRASQVAMRYGQQDHQPPIEILTMHHVLRAKKQRKIKSRPYRKRKQIAIKRLKSLGIRVVAK